MVGSLCGFLCSFYLAPHLFTYLLAIWIPYFVCGHFRFMIYYSLFFLFPLRCKTDLQSSHELFIGYKWYKYVFPIYRFHFHFCFLFLINDHFESMGINLIIGVIIISCTILWLWTEFLLANRSQLFDLTSYSFLHQLLH